MAKNSIYDKDNFIEVGPIDWELVGEVTYHPIEEICSDLTEKYGNRFYVIQKNLYWTKETDNKYDKYVNKFRKSIGMKSDKKNEDTNYLLVQSRISAPFTFLRAPKWAKANYLYIRNDMDVMAVHEAMAEESDPNGFYWGNDE